METWLDPALIIALILFSAFFSSSETSLFAIDEVKLKRIRLRDDKRRVKKLISNTSLLLITLIACNTAVNTALAALLEKELYMTNIIYSTIAVAMIILFFGELIPKTAAIIRAEELSAFNSRIIYPLFLFLSPLSRLVNKLTDGILGILKKIRRIPLENLSRDRERISAILSIVSREDIFNPDEKRLIENIIHFTEREVWNIMTPRTRVFSVEKSMPIKEVLRLARRMKMSKIPVYERTDDNLTGVIFLKDIFHYSLYPEKIGLKKTSDIMEPVYFVPETKKLSDMLDDFKRKNLRIAAVVDEYGSSLGIVTMADILGEIVGELMDESFTVDKKIIPLSNDRFLVNGELSLADFNEYFQTSLKSIDYETLAGFVIETAGDIPDAGYIYETDNYTISVRERSEKQIELFMVERK